MVTNGCARFAESDDFGMASGIGVANVAIPSAGYDLTVADHDRPYRYFVYLEGALGAAQGFLHPKFVGTVAGGWLVVRGHARMTLYVPTGSNLVSA
jgi:hypothetical protein